MELVAVCSASRTDLYSELEYLTVWRAVDDSD